jgi:hypothetical protein
MCCVGVVPISEEYHSFEGFITYFCAVIFSRLLVWSYGNISLLIIYIWTILLNSDY